LNGKQKVTMNKNAVNQSQTQGGSLFEHVEAGIYRNTSSNVYFERPKIHGRRTWRSLETSNLKYAREELHKRRAAVGTDKDPYAEPEAATVGEIISRYQKDGYLDKNLSGRTGGTLVEEERNCGKLLQFWSAIPVATVTDAICDRYRDWRIKRVKSGTGKRVIDRELNTLNNAFRYAKRRAIVRLNPVADRPRYQTSKEVRHCREFMPGNTDELHEFVAVLMKNPHSVVLGFQQLFEAMTGLRTSEILKLRTAATSNEPGYVTPDGKSLRVWRCKGQHSVNPFAKVHDGLKALLEAHKKWKEENYPESPWYFPSPRGVDGPVEKRALGHALLRLHLKKGMKKFISHGMRAFYVTVRRSHGITDPQIAFEIGHTSGGATLAAVYGGVPPHWMTGEGPKMSWLPISVKPAWESINSEPTKPQCPAQNNGVPAACPRPASTACNEVSPEPALPATEPNGAQSCPPKRKSSVQRPCVITNDSYPQPPFVLN
jgi:integrase